MDWTGNFRSIMTDMAAEDGLSYEDAMADLAPSELFLVDRKLWLRRLLRRR